MNDRTRVAAIRSPVRSRSFGPMSRDAGAPVPAATAVVRVNASVFASRFRRRCARGALWAASGAVPVGAAAVAGGAGAGVRSGGTITTGWIDGSPSNTNWARVFRSIGSMTGHSRT